MLSELDSLYLDWIWQLDSVARLNNVWWANLRFDFGIWFECDLTVYLISGSWFQFMLVLWFWQFVCDAWQLVSGNWCLVLSWSISSLGSTWAFCFDTWFQPHMAFLHSSFQPILYFPASSPAILSFPAWFLVTSPSLWQELTRHAQF